MATNWPNSVQTFTNPTTGSALNSPSHADQHATVNDTVEALQNYAGLVLVKSVAVGSSVSSVNVSSAFDTRFENYRIVLEGAQGSFTYQTVYFKLGSATQYYSNSPYWNTSGSDGVSRTTGTAGDYPSIALGSATSPTSFVLDVIAPNLAKYTHGTAQSFNDIQLRMCGFTQKSNTQFTDFTVYPNTGPFSGGTIRVYGYNNGA